MHRQPVSSDMIRSWGFDAARELLEIEFHNGRIYQYADVPEFIARGFGLAESKGRYFLSKIDGRYKSQEVRGPQDPALPLNCPKCAARLAWVRTEGSTHFYSCAHHGSIVIPPDGPVRVEG